MAPAPAQKFTSCTCERCGSCPPTHRIGKPRYIGGDGLHDYCAPCARESLRSDPIQVMSVFSPRLWKREPGGARVPTTAPSW